MRGGKLSRYEWPVIVKMTLRRNKDTLGNEDLIDMLDSIVSLEEFNTKPLSFKVELLNGLINLVILKCKKFQAFFDKLPKKEPLLQDIARKINLLKGEFVSGNRYYLVEEEEYKLMAVLLPNGDASFILNQEELDKHIEYSRESGYDLAYFDELTKVKLDSLKNTQARGFPLTSVKVSFSRTIEREGGLPILEEDLDKVSKGVGFSILGHIKNHDLAVQKQLLLDYEYLWTQKMNAMGMYYIDFDWKDWVRTDDSGETSEERQRLQGSREGSVRDK